MNAARRDTVRNSGIREIRVKRFLDVLALLALGTMGVHGLGTASRRRSTRTRFAAARRSAAEAQGVGGTVLRCAVPADDERLRERLRARLGRVGSVRARSRSRSTAARSGCAAACGRTSSTA